MLSNTQKKGLAFIVSAPAGTGKTTLVNRLVAEFSNVVMSLSCTTRPPRSAEQDGIHYQFLTTAEFEGKIEDNEFLEFVKLYGTYYGSSKSWVENARKNGKHVILVIDTQGALNLRGRYDAITIFLSPPSISELKNRLMKRGTEDEISIAKRLAEAENELNKAPFYDYQIVNDNLDRAYDVLRSIVIAESHKTSYIK